MYNLKIYISKLFLYLKHDKFLKITLCKNT